MNAVLGYALLAPAALFGHAAKDEWQPYTSIESRVKFEMPLPPRERLLEAEDGTRCHIFDCSRDEFAYETVALDLPSEIQEAAKEVVSDSEETITRQILRESIQGYLDQTKGKITSDEYLRFKKLPARVCTVTWDKNREARIMSVMGRAHAYIFTVSYPKGGNGSPVAKRFFDSIVFQN